MANAEVQMQFEKVKGLVTEFVKRNPYVFATVERMDIISVRTVEVTVYTEKQAKEDNSYKDLVDKYITPIIVELRNKLVLEGYNVSDVEDFLIGTLDSGRPYVSFRCSTNSVKREEITKPNDIGMPSMQRGEDGNVTWA